MISIHSLKSKAKAMSEMSNFWAPFAVAGVLSAIWFFKVQPMASFMWSDMATYMGLASNIRREFFPLRDTFYPPGYSLLNVFILNAGLDSLTLMPLLHWISFLLGIALTTASCRRIYGGRVAYVCAWILALHFPFYSAFSYFMPECFFFLILSGLFFMTARPLARISQRRWLGIGLLLGVALWFKGLAVYSAPLWCLAISGGTKPVSTKLKNCICLTLGFGVALLALGFFYRSMYHVRRYVPANGALNFVEGKCPSKRNHDSEGYWFHSPLNAQLERNTTKYWDAPFYDDAYYWRQGWKCVKNEPSLIFTELKEIYYLFFENVIWPGDAAPYAPLTRFTCAFFSSAFWCILAIALFLLRSKFLDLLHHSVVVPVGGLFISVWFTHSEMRYRVPFDGFLIALVSACLVLGIARARSIQAQRRNHPRKPL